MMKNMKSRGAIVALVVVLVVVVAGGAYLLWPSRGGHKVVAYFTNAVGLYAGDDVRVLGVPVGTIDSVEPQANSVKVSMTVQDGVKFPADARAIIISPNLVAARFVQFTPAYDGGAALAGGAEDRRLVETALALERAALHLHFPEGASPKDGPSAGLSVAVALLSLALRQPFNAEFALSGEIALNGHVLRVGGLREKLLAARREGLRQVVLPRANRPDVMQLKPQLREGLTFHFVHHFEEVFALLFTAPAEQPVAAERREQGQTISVAAA